MDKVVELDTTDSNDYTKVLAEFKGVPETFVIEEYSGQINDAYDTYLPEYRVFDVGRGRYESYVIARDYDEARMGAETRVSNIIQGEGYDALNQEWLMGYVEPDEEEKQVLEQNIQIALQGGQIDLEDAIDIREVNNLKLANQMLKKRRKDKAARDQQAQQANIQAQAQANAQLAEQTAMAEAQKQQILTEQKLQLEKAKSDFDVQKMEREAQVKMQLMEQEFNYNMQLAQMQGQAKQQAEDSKEDRKDERTKIQATQQSELIDQRKNDLLPNYINISHCSSLDRF